MSLTILLTSARRSFVDSSSTRAARRLLENWGVFGRETGEPSSSLERTPKRDPGTMGSVGGAAGLLAVRIQGRVSARVLTLFLLQECTLFFLGVVLI